MERGKKYEPTQADFDLAEASMSEEQKEMSRVRAELWEQERPLWESFSDKVDKDFRRKEPSGAETRAMNESLSQLAELFRDSSVTWLLDGALNISLFRGDWIGVHKDVDISVERDQLRTLEAELAAKGYGLFFSIPPKEGGTSYTMRRVNADDFARAKESSLSVVAIDADGRILDDAPLNYLDVHVIARNEEGQPISPTGSVLPEGWLRPLPAKIDNGGVINLSQPARIAYYKIRSEREYDFTDLERLAETGYLTEGGLDAVVRVCQNDFQLGLEKGEREIGKVLARMKPGTTPEQVFEIFLSLPAFAERINEQTEETYRGIARLYAEAYAQDGESSARGIFESLLVHYKINEREEERQARIEHLREIARAAREAGKPDNSHFEL
ncbi:MAG: hypothetical protein WC516_03430 [Patescibacteria group bacterium]